MPECTALSRNLKLKAEKIVFSIFVPVCFLLSIQTFGQPDKPDSITIAFNKIKDPEKKLTLYGDLAFKLCNTNPDSAIGLATIGLQTAEKMKNVDEQARNCNVLGLVNKNKGAYTKSVDYFKKAIKLYQLQKDLKNESRVHINLASTYLQMAKYQQALEENISSAGILKQLKDSLALSYIYQQISIVYRSTQNYKEAEKNIQKAISYASFKIGDSAQRLSSLAASLASYGILLRLNNRYDTAAILLLHSIQTYKKAGNMYNMAIGYENLGDVYNDAKKYSDALSSYSKAVDIFKSLNSDVDVGYEYLKIAYTKKDLKQYDEVLQICNTALAIFKGEEMVKYRKDVYQILWELYDEKGDKINAYTFYKKYNQLKDSLLSEDNQKELLRLQQEYESVQKENEIIKLGNEKILQDQLISRKNQFTIIIVILFFISAIIAWILYNRYKLKKQLEQTLIRNQIAGDLHDDVGATLSSIRLYSQLARQQMPAESSVDAQAFLEKININAAEMIDNMSDIVWMVKPGNDLFENLEARMQSFAGELCEAKNIHFEYSNESGGAVMLPMQLRRDIYLIFKEAISNAVKYSGCTRISAKIIINPSTLTMKIADNGNGFSPENLPAKSNGGNGLGNMQQRAIHNKGEFNLQSAPGKGTQITVSFAI